MRILAIDSEYEHANTFSTQLGGFSYSWEEGVASFLPWTSAASQVCQRLLDEAEIVVMHNQVADSMVLSRHGINIPYDKLHCTLVMAYVLREEELGLKSLASKYCGMNMVELSEYTGQYGTKSFVDILDLPINIVWPYACRDADATRRLYLYLKKKLEAEPKLNFIYESIERPLFPVVVDMQKEGMLVDVERCRTLDGELAEVEKLLAEGMRSIVGRPLSWGHSPAVQEYVYGELGYPVQTGKEGRPTLDSKQAIPTLRSLGGYPTKGEEFLRTLADWRHVRKLRSSYTQTLPLIVDCNNYVHPTFKQAGAGTGRFSCAEPNIQQIPIRASKESQEEGHPLGEWVRELFIAPEGYDWVGPDLSGIELRTFAMVARDRVLIKGYQENPNFDPHQYVEDIIGTPRRANKVLTYGRMFGQGEEAAYQEVAKNFQENHLPPPTREEFKVMRRKHAQLLPSLSTYVDKIKGDLLRQGYVETWLGRRIYFKTARGHDLRSAQSSPPQGTAADLMKIILRNMWEMCKREGAVLIGTVHDETPIYARKEDSKRIGILAKEVMETAVNWPVPIMAEVKIGKNWAEAH